MKIHILFLIYKSMAIKSVHAQNFKILLRHKGKLWKSQFFRNLLISWLKSIWNAISYFLRIWKKMKRWNLWRNLKRWPSGVWFVTLKICCFWIILGIFILWISKKSKRWPKGRISCNWNAIQAIFWRLVRKPGLNLTIKTPKWSKTGSLSSETTRNCQDWPFFKK